MQQERRLTRATVQLRGETLKAIEDHRQRMAAAGGAAPALAALLRVCVERGLPSVLLGASTPAQAGGA